MNDNIIYVLNQYLQQIISENAIIYRINAIKNLIKIIKKYPKEIINSDELKDFKGIGKSSILKINEILKTGTLSYLNNNNNVSNELIKIFGIGNTIANKLIKKYQIKSLQDFKDRVKKGEIKVNDNIKIGLKYEIKETIPKKDIDDIQLYLKQFNYKFIICGSYRREQSFSNDIDILLYSPYLLTLEEVKNSNLLNEYIKLLTDKKLIIENITNNNITKYNGIIKWNKKIRRIDIRLIPYESIYSALVYFTGPYELNIIMRKKAKDLGYKLNEYGLYKNNKFIYITSEKELFKKLNMKFLKPHERNIFI
jgi:DNA polymerase/3'-5' exonuclease PolX